MARLLIYHTQEATWKEFDLKHTGQVVIGRFNPRSVADIKIKCAFVSPYHCTITLMCDDDRLFYRLRDGVIFGKSSTNGTWVNKNRIKEHILSHNDVITFCKEVDYPSIVFKEKQEEDYDSTIEHEFE